MALPILLVMSSAASCFYVRENGSPPPITKRVLARGHLTGTPEIEQVVTWHTRAESAEKLIAHLAVRDNAKPPRVIWQADEPFPASDIGSVQIIDLDGDSIPEVLSLWWHSGSHGARLRVFHWDRNSRNFVELSFKGGEPRDDSIHGYRLRGGPRGKRIVLYKNAAVIAGEFELRGSEIARVGGGDKVSTQGSSGIEGRAVISPAHPGPVRDGETDTAPFKTALVISRASDGAVVARLETGSDGRFRVALPPGTYKVGPPLGTGQRLPRASEEIVNVVPGKFAHVTISFDSGMR
jgi:hypothetical protein